MTTEVHEHLCDTLSKDWMVWVSQNCYLWQDCHLETPPVQDQLTERQNQLCGAQTLDNGAMEKVSLSV